MSNKNSDPTTDGECLPYFPLAGNVRKGTRFYYVNGINTSAAAHREVAELIANITESIVWGVYNESNGMASDLAQCLGDWARIVQLQLGEQGFVTDRLSQSVIDNLSQIVFANTISRPLLHALRESLIAPAEVVAKQVTLEKLRAALKRNLAALSLFDELSQHTKSRQIVIAHSQGNLITSLALWALQAAYGSRALQNIQVRSISSPSPAWPRGINHKIKVYGQRDDLVTWADPKNLTGNRSEGFWDTYFKSKNDQSGKPKPKGAIAPHNVRFNIEQTNLYRRLQDDAGVAKF